MPDPFLDALGVKDPTEAAPPTSSGVSPFYKDPVDAAVRTVIAEGSGDPDEAQWIAGVIRNRTQGGKKAILDVLGEPGAFESWGSDEGRKRMGAVDPNSAAYQKLSAAVSPILLGQSPDPSNGAVNFYAPEAQKALSAKDGRPVKAKFDDGSGVQIGKTLFFGGQNAVTDPFLRAIGAEGRPQDPEDTQGAKVIPYEGLKQTLNDDQTKFLQTYQKGGLYDPTAEPGSEHRPFFVQPGATEADVPPGAYFVDRSGKLQRGADVPGKSSFGAGLSQGVGDVLTTMGDVAEKIPGFQDSELANRFRSDQALYGAQYGGDLKSGLGRFTGQLVGSAPFLAGGEAALAPLLGRAGMAGAFAAGRAGEIGAGIAPLTLRGMSLAARGAGEGAGAAGLTSSANPDPAMEQILKGALGGAVLGPAIPAAVGAGKWAGGTIRSLTEPLTTSGRDAMADRIISRFAGESPMAGDASVYVPGSTPSLAMATGNPGVAGLERTLRLDPRQVERFTALDQANAQARADFLGNTRGDRLSVADLANDRNAILENARKTAFAGAQPVDAHSLAKVIDEALTSPEAHMEEVARPLQTLRDKLVKPPPEMPAEELAKFNGDVAKTFGGDGAALTPEVMQAARDKLGAKFQDIAGKTEVQWDDKLRGDIAAIIKNTADVVPESQLPPLFKQLDNIASTVDQKSEAMGLGHVEKGPATISGASYQALTKKGSPLDSLMKAADPTIRSAASGIRDALDDALERTVGAKPAIEGEPNLIDELRSTRLQYKNLKTVESALRSAGPDKQVSPQAVYNAVKQNFGQFAYQGGGPLGDVAESAVKANQSRAPLVESDARQVFGMRSSLDAAISKLEKQGTDAANIAADRLRAVRGEMDKGLESAAPGYTDYMDLSRRSAEPVEAMNYLQNLNVTDMKGNVTLGKLDAAMKRIAADRAKAGNNPAKSISPATLEQLEALRADLMRNENLFNGKTQRGSDTMQHVATGNIASQFGVPLAVGASAFLHHPLVAGAVGAGKLFYAAKNKELMDQLTTKLLSADLPAGVTPAPAIDDLKARLLRGAARPILPAAGGILANRFVGQRPQ